MNGASLCHVNCNWCGRPTRPIWVHGHAQCEHCRINIEPCCEGDMADGSAGDTFAAPRAD